jgi:hypothetical protein
LIIVLFDFDRSKNPDTRSGFFIYYYDKFSYLKLPTISSGFTQASKSSAET